MEVNGHVDVPNGDEHVANGLIDVVVSSEAHSDSQVVPSQVHVDVHALSLHNRAPTLANVDEVIAAPTQPMTVAPQGSSRSVPYLLPPHPILVNQYENPGYSILNPLYVLMVNAGENIISKIIEFGYRYHCGISIINANGGVLNPILGNGDSSERVTYEGRYEILRLSGSLMVTEPEGMRRNDQLTTFLAGPNENLVLGRIEGALVAATQVELIAATQVEVILGLFPRARLIAPQTMPSNESNRQEDMN